MLTIDCRTSLRRTRLFERVKTASCFAVRVEKIGIDYADDCCEQTTAGEEGRSALLGVKGKDERAYENDGALAGLNGVFVGLLYSAVPAPSQNVTVETKLVCFC